MDRKTLDKKKLSKLIMLNRAMRRGKMTIDDACNAMASLAMESEEGYIFWSASRDVISGILWGINEEATNEQIFNIFQILGYDIV